jgi:hypothetical protein
LLDLSCDADERIVEVEPEIDFEAIDEIFQNKLLTGPMVVMKFFLLWRLIQW